MKKLVSFLSILIVATSLYAQNIENKVGTNGEFKVFKNDGTTSLFGLSETGDHRMQFSTDQSAFTIFNSNSPAEAVFRFDDRWNQGDLPRLAIGNVDNVWLDGEFPHLILQGGLTLDNVLAMVSRSSSAKTNRINGYRAGGDATNPTNVIDGDYMLFFNSYGYAGGDYRDAAGIHFIVDGTPGASHVPGKIEFLTGTDAAIPATRMTIGSNGNVRIENQLSVIGTANFGALTGASAVFNTVQTNSTIDVFGKATIHDVLKLTPRADVPASPELGMIYYNSGDNKLYLYTGVKPNVNGGWEALN